MKSEVNKLSQQPTTPLLSQATEFPPEDTSQLLFQGSILPPVKSRESFALYQSCMPHPSQASFSLQKFDSPKSDQMFLNLSCCNEKSHFYQKLRKCSSSWLSDSSFSSWLTFDESKMRCKVCLTSKKKNNFTAGCSDMQRTALSRHMNCPDRMSALLDLEQRKAMVIATQNSFSEEEKAVLGELRTVNWLAKEKLASSKFSSLSSLLSFQGVDYVQRLNKEDPTRKGYQLTYQSSNSVADFQAALNSVVEENVLSILQKSALIGLMTDESTDINVSRKLMVYVKAVHPETRKACEFYIADVELAGEANSENITKALSRLLKKKNIDRRLVVRLATDGAPVVTGTKSGVGVRLRRKCSPYLIQVHCVVHRLALASEQAADAVPLFKLYQATINSVYNYFAHSSTRTSHLRCLQTVVDDHRVTLHATFSTRWLSFRGAVDAVRKSFCSLVLCLEHEAEEGCASARGLLRAVNKASFLLATYGLSDVLTLLNKLSLVLQRKALNYADVGPIVKATVDALLSLKHCQGPNLASLIAKRKDDNITLSSPSGVRVPVNVSEDTLQSFLNSSFWQFLQKLLDNVHARFPSVAILDALSVFDPRNLPPIEDLVGYGDQQIRMLINHFGEQALEKPGFVNEDAMTEWLICRPLMSNKFRNQTMVGFGSAILFEHRDVFPHLSLLLLAGLVVPVTNAGC